jgi:exopolyphosphatase / guanosine-5'-triphosphate,3'-diphosphate pyrophosphatase
LLSALRLRPTGRPESSSVLVGVLDVGSNTMRLLVAGRRKQGVVRVHELREQLGLGEDVEQLGLISPEKLHLAEASAAALVEKARSLGCSWVDVLVTSPGRQAANGEELREAVARGSGLPARILTAEEEAELAYAGALSATDLRAQSVAVVDVGGGSTQLVVGTGPSGPVWARSVDIGSLRLTRRLLVSDPPSIQELEAARGEVERSFETIAPPLPLAALATGGSARAVRRVAGRRRLTARHLEAVLRELAKRPSADLVRRYGLAPQRARTLAAGTIILAETQRRLGLPLEIARGGLREGAALALLEERATTAA